MRKSFLLAFFVLISLGLQNSAFSARYGNHPVTYSNPGLTNLYNEVGSGPNMGTVCDDDTDGIDDTGYNKAAKANSSTTLNPNLETDPIILGSGNSGTMNCLYWDEQEPSGFVSYSNTNSTNSSVEVTIVCSDTGGSGYKMDPIEGWTIDGNTYKKTFTENTSGTGSITIKDVAGNSKNIEYNISNIDTTPPNWKVEYTTIYWTTEPIKVSITCIDEESGCDMYSIDGWDKNGNIYSKVFEENTDGTIIIKDLAGNTSTVPYGFNNIGDPLPDDEVLSYTGTVITKDYVANVSGNYNGILLKVSSGGLDYVLAIPSLISANLEEDGISNIVNHGNFVYDKYSNIPHSYKKYVKYDGLVDYKPDTLVIYIRESKNYFTKTELKAILYNLRKVYKNSVFSKNKDFEELLYGNNEEGILIYLSSELNGKNHIDKEGNSAKAWKSIDPNCNKTDIIIGSQVWAPCNSTLGIGTDFNEHTCYDYNGGMFSCDANNILPTSKEGEYKAGFSDNIFGKKYTGDNAISACPSGWHVPTDDDWKILESKLKCNEGSISQWRCEGLGWRNSNTNYGNLVNILGLPLAGSIVNGDLDLIGYTGTYWTSTEKPDDNTQKAIREFSYNFSKVYRDYMSVNNSYSVRCIKD